MVKIQFLTSCEAPGCVALHTLEFEWHPSFEFPPRPHLPEGWQQIGTKTFCERHKIAVALTVDGQPVEMA